MKSWQLRNKKSRWVLAVVVAAALVAGGGAYYALSPAPQAALLTDQVDSGDIEKVVLATGTIKPSVQVNVGAQVNGQLRKLFVRQGERVQKGQLLAEIDPTIQQSDLRNATAQLDSARAQKAASEATLIQYRKALDRELAMQRDGSGVTSDLDLAQAQYDAQVQQVAMNEALIVQAEMAVQTANANLSYTRIVAPMDGEVLGIVTREGQTIVSSQTAPTILVLANLDKMLVQTRISEADIQKIHPGQSLWFYVIADPDKRYESELGYVQPAPQEALEDQSGGYGASNQQSNAVYYNGTFEVDNTERLLKTSMTAQVFIRVAEAKNVLRMPVSALGRSLGDDRYQVTVLEVNGPQERTVRIGINDRQFAEVVEGLIKGESVVIQQDRVQG
ncbi:efflux RND transporter periplasmic adaptor subunit [Entomohabitans teleogrylli]|uniref:efflux RND transporter periplasmic adaptor subunit n=1 Tax=Entomohabitans teleogrylli TaxID=1384589 RepID=UPI00073D5060|nr:efflux RND transporter periplasmic adaptor subunit [Entomohabitans teleogrylli]